MSENNLTIPAIDIIRLEEDTVIQSFDSEDQDLNDFLLNDAKNYAGMGIGRSMIEAVIAIYVSQQQSAGCRFITVDAYRNALTFYEKNEFKFLTEKDKDEETRAMYFDLKSVG